MSPIAGPAGRPPARPRPRTVPAALVTFAVLVLTLGLASCGTADGSADGLSRDVGVAAWTDARTGVLAVARQADAQLGAAAEAARTGAADAAERAAAEQARRAAVEAQGGAGQPAARPGGSAADEPAQCTTRPEDRAACTTPEGAEVTPGGGDVDGDGVFEPHEPVGPGYKDPRAYDGGPTSGETQCQWAREQGHGC
ncbi:hypothetical protein E4198_15665 [Streptomyces sp. RKND-216]|uniref:hypothetical protein n=1 Tax=Streptomyces sp. RKND-216 TaxID=2562581 RepID=UPI00109DDB14|nr:hypothetical protein [Streptomyces sp. RKND-216]THA25944.1 hypothetical protein E4198_15665 [Streptomyces sp. RKND-216]